MDQKHWTDRSATWNFEIDVVAQAEILGQLTHFSRERKLKTLVLPDEPQAKTGIPQDVHGEDANVSWGDVSAAQSDFSQKWQNEDPFKSKLVQTSNLRWGLSPTKLWFPPALEDARRSVRYRLTL